MTLRQSQTRLAQLWFGMAGLIFLLVWFRGLHAPGADGAGLWSWFLPTVVPTLSLIVGVLVAQARAPARAAGRVDPFLYRLALGMSAFYLLLLALVLLLRPFFLERPLGDYLAATQVWLAPLQGLVSAALGAFYVKREPDDGDTAGREPGMEEGTAARG